MARASLGVSDTFGGICPRSYCDLSLSPRIHLRFSPVPSPTLGLHPQTPARLLGSWPDQKLAMAPGALCGQHKCPGPQYGPAVQAS